MRILQYPTHQSSSTYCASWTRRTISEYTPTGEPTQKSSPISSLQSHKLFNCYIYISRGVTGYSRVVTNVEVYCAEIGGFEEIRRAWLALLNILFAFALQLDGSE